MEPDSGDSSVRSQPALETVPFHDFWGWGRRYAQRLLANEADSEDVVQEAFCRLVARRSAALSTNGSSPGSEFATSGETAAIFFKIVRNLCIDKLRRKKLQSNVDGQQWIERTPGVELHAIAKETRQQVESALARLPERWRQALLLRAYELNYEEISRVMNCTKPQVRTWIFRARQQLSCELMLEERP